MFYFAYGINLSRRQMVALCPDCQPKFSAELPNYKLIFTGWSRQWHGGLVSIRSSRGDKVLGGIYEITEADLAKLDRHEEYPKNYNRLEVTVYRDSGEQIKAVTYIKTLQSEETKPSVEYVKIIQQGYHDWGLI
jgi:gamma-glutamylcyclotransferase (GGCT)/AIG2-like uncharacterized protein YtfP